MTHDHGNLVDFGKATYRKMIQNLFWAMSYNVVAIPLAAGVPEVRAESGDERGVDECQHGDCGPERPVVETEFEPGFGPTTSRYVTDLHDFNHLHT